MKPKASRSLRGRAKPSNAVWPHSPAQTAQLAPPVSSPRNLGQPSLPPAQPAALSSRIALVAAALFVAGSLASIIWLALGYWRLWRILSRARPAPAHVTSMAPAHTRLMVSDQQVGPFYVGPWRPVIVIPAPLCLPEHAPLLQHVVAHELAHARQGDGRGRLLAALALPLFWCHPLYWWLRKRVRLDAELIADACAAAQSSSTTYARQLVTLADSTLAAGPVPAGAPSILGHPREFTRRIEMLLSRHAPIATRCSPLRHGLQGLFAVVLAVGTSAIFGATTVHAQSADDYKVLLKQNEMLREELASLGALVADMKAKASVEQAQQAAIAESNASPFKKQADTALTEQHKHSMEALLHAAGYLQSEQAAYELNALRNQATAPQSEKMEGKLLKERTSIRGTLMPDAATAPVGPPALRAHSAALDPALFSMIDRLLTLRGSVRSAERDLGQLSELVGQNLVSKNELHEAQENLEAQIGKLKLLKLLFKGEVAATEIEMSSTKKQHKEGAEAQLVRLQVRLEALRSAL